MTLTQAELDSMRATVEEFFPDTCDIVEPSNLGRSTGGGITTGSPTTTSDVPCHLTAMGRLTAAEKTIADKLSIVNPALVLFAHDQSMSQRAKLVFTNGEEYEVRGMIPRIAWSTSLRVICERVR